MKAYLSLFIFLLFSNAFTAQNLNADCSNPYTICEKGSYSFEGLTDFGNEEENLRIADNGNMSEIGEKNTKWLEWGIKKSGIITFEIDPSSFNDDFDFVLYKAEENDRLEPVRIMLSGANLNDRSTRKRCHGKTGLRNKAKDKIENPGCNSEDDNYLAPLIASKGERYILFLNSFQKSQAFQFDIAGSAVLTNRKCLVSDRSIAETSINIYPNPVTDILIVDFQSFLSREKTEIQILDLAGKIVETQIFMPDQDNFQKSIETSALPSGQYILKIKQLDHFTNHKFLKF